MTKMNNFCIPSGSRDATAASRASHTLANNGSSLRAKYRLSVQSAAVSATLQRFSRMMAALKIKTIATITTTTMIATRIITMIYLKPKSFKDGTLPNRASLTRDTFFSIAVSMCLTN